MAIEDYDIGYTRRRGPLTFTRYHVHRNQDTGTRFFQVFVDEYNYTQRGVGFQLQLGACLHGISFSVNLRKK